jgi:hypothetical protein
MVDEGVMKDGGWRKKRKRKMKRKRKKRSWL